jgi:hypothetical protein
MQASPYALHKHNVFGCAAVRSRPGTVSFAFVRNPWSRVLTCAAWNGITHLGTQRSEAEERELRVQRFRVWARKQFAQGKRGDCSYLQSLVAYTHCNGTAAVDFLGCTEHLQRDFAALSHLLNISDTGLASMASHHCLNSCSKVRIGRAAPADDTSALEYATLQQRRLSLKEAYDTVTRELVARAWHDDQQIYNFSFDDAVAEEQASDDTILP